MESPSKLKIIVTLITTLIAYNGNEYKIFRSDFFIDKNSFSDLVEEKWVNPWKPIEEIDNNSRDGERMFNNKMDNYIDYKHQRLGYLLQ